MYEQNKKIIAVIGWSILLCSCSIYEVAYTPPSTEYQKVQISSISRDCHHAASKARPIDNHTYTSHYANRKNFAKPTVSSISIEGINPMTTLFLKTSQQLDSMSPLMYASYLKPTGIEMVKVGGYSPDNGQTWEGFSPSPNFNSNLPYGYRRRVFPLFVDHTNGRLVRIVLSMDTPGLDPRAIESSIGLTAYYLRYRVSLDGGRTYLFDEPIIQKRHTKEKPFEGVYWGKNAIFMGDVGSQPLRTRAGEIIIPAQTTELGWDGKPFSPGGFAYINTVMIIGRWVDKNRLEWEISKPIVGDPAHSTRGMLEPTLAEGPDGRLLVVMRGSNGGSKDPQFKIPSYRWYSTSKDGGYHWSKPEPWIYDDGTPFYSPSSMSQLLNHSSGRIFWLGNINPSNSRGDLPRYPLVIGEVDPKTLRLMKNTLLVIDTKRPEEYDINLSHWWAFEDRLTHDIVVVGARHAQGYRSKTPWLWRVRVNISDGCD